MEEIRGGGEVKARNGSVTKRERKKVRQIYPSTMLGKTAGK